MDRVLNQVQNYLRHLPSAYVLASIVAILVLFTAGLWWQQSVQAEARQQHIQGYVELVARHVHNVVLGHELSASSPQLERIQHNLEWMSAAELATTTDPRWRAAQAQPERSTFARESGGLRVHRLLPAHLQSPERSAYSFHIATKPTERYFRLSPWWFAMLIVLALSALAYAACIWPRQTRAASEQVDETRAAQQIHWALTVADTIDSGVLVFDDQLMLRAVNPTARLWRNEQQSLAVDADHLCDVAAQLPWGLSLNDLIDQLSASSVHSAFVSIDKQGSRYGITAVRLEDAEQRTMGYWISCEQSETDANTTLAI